MLTNLLIASAFIVISIIAILKFTYLFQILSTLFSLAVNFVRHMKFLITTLARAYSRYQKLTNNPYLRGL